jgi:hypothetical protein
MDGVVETFEGLQGKGKEYTLKKHINKLVDKLFVHHVKWLWESPLFFPLAPMIITR